MNARVLSVLSGKLSLTIQETPLLQKRNRLFLVFRDIVDASKDLPA